MRTSRLGLIMVMLMALLVPASAQASINLVDAIAPIDRSGPLAIQPAGGDSAAGLWVAHNEDFPYLMKYSLDGQTVTGSISPGTEASGDLLLIAGIAVNEIDDRIYVTDGNPVTGDGRLLSFEMTTGDTVAQTPGLIGDPIMKGTNPGEFDTPVGVTYVPALDLVYVADKGNDRTQSFFPAIFIPNGTTSGFSSTGPIATVYDEETLHNFIAFSDGTIAEFDGNTGIRTYGPGDVPTALAVDPDASLLYVAVGDAVDIYSTITGQTVGSIPVAMGEDPFGMAIDPLNRRLYLSVRPADVSQSRVDIFSYSPPPACTTQNLTVVTGSALDGSLACADADALPFTYNHLPIDLPANGSLSLNSSTGAFTYTPDAGYVGGDSFTYRMLSANGASEVTTTNVDVTAAPPDPPDPPDPPTIPDPVASENTNLSRSSGKVLIRLPGQKGFTVLDKDSQVPLGTVVDARKGKVTATLANPDKSTYSGKFWAGVFQIRQEKDKKKPFGIIKLRDDLVKPVPVFSAAGPAGPIASVSALRRRNKVWGSAKGKFKTSGRGSSASVRGTIWLVDNQAKGTLTRVREGSVKVRDFARRKNVIVKRGQKYFAPYKKRK